MAPHSGTLAWKIPWTEEPGGLQSMGSLGVGHDWATSLSLFTFMHWRRKWQPTPVFLPGESQGRRSLVGGCLWGRIELTRLKWLSSSSSSSSRNEIHEVSHVWLLSLTCFEVHPCCVFQFTSFLLVVVYHSIKFLSIHWAVNRHLECTYHNASHLL